MASALPRSLVLACAASRSLKRPTRADDSDPNSALHKRPRHNAGASDEEDAEMKLESAVRAICLPAQSFLCLVQTPRAGAELVQCANCDQQTPVRVCSRANFIISVAQTAELACNWCHEPRTTSVHAGDGKDQQMSDDGSDDPPSLRKPSRAATGGSSANPSVLARRRSPAPVVLVCNSCGERYEKSSVTNCTLCESAHLCGGFLHFQLDANTAKYVRKRTQFAATQLSRSDNAAADNARALAVPGLNGSI